MKNLSFSLSKFSILFFSLLIIISTFFLGYICWSITGSSTKHADADLTLFWKVWGILDDKYVAHSTSTPAVSEQDRIYGAIEGNDRISRRSHTLFSFHRKRLKPSMKR
jgi:hypothetical protein